MALQAKPFKPHLQFVRISNWFVQVNSWVNINMFKLSIDLAKTQWTLMWFPNYRKYISTKQLFLMSMIYSDFLSQSSILALTFCTESKTATYKINIFNLFTKNLKANANIESVTNKSILLISWPSLRSAMIALTMAWSNTKGLCQILQQISATLYDRLY